jgi:flavin reductase (DIM6/NTAB) family NADH-FMN oxidoreductase RutF
MIASSQDFKDGMRRLTGGVTVITTAHDASWFGLTATAVCSVSADPARLLVCVNRQGGSYAAICASRVFTVNVLAAEDEAMARRFAGLLNEPGQDRFAKGLWVPGVNGAPYLKSAMASFECKVGSIVDTGSHGIIIGEVMTVRNSAISAPLVYLDGCFLTTRQLETQA